jgi:hypothetical protein
MAGMAHFKAALLIAANDGASLATIGIESNLGHNLGITAHGLHHGVFAGNGAAAAASVDAGLDAHLATWLAALDARYAAGAHAGPVISSASLKGALATAAAQAAKAIMESFESSHGRGARGLAHSGALATDVSTAVNSDAAMASELASFLADIDARYVAGVTASPAGAVMAGALEACKHCAVAVVNGAGVELETGCRGHWASAHYAPHLAEAVAAAESVVAASVPAGLTFLLGLWDARYQAHA